MRPTVQPNMQFDPRILKKTPGWWCRSGHLHNDVGCIQRDAIKRSPQDVFRAGRVACLRSARQIRQLYGTVTLPPYTRRLTQRVLGSQRPAWRMEQIRPDEEAQKPTCASSVVPL